MKCYTSTIINPRDNVVTNERFIRNELLMCIMEQIKDKLIVEKFPNEFGIEYRANIHVFTNEELVRLEQDIERDVLSKMDAKKKKPLR